MSLQVGTVQNKYREDFSAVDTLAGWDIVLGQGMSIDLSTASGIRILAGNTPNSKTTMRYTNIPFETPVRAVFYALGTALVSQRVANQEIEFRLVSEDGTEYVSWLLDGTSAVVGKQRSANRGVAGTDTSVAIPDTSNGSAALELESWIDETYWHTRAADNTNARAGSFVRNRRVPDPHTKLFLEISVRNLATAPTAGTVVALDAITVQDISEMTAEITGGRGAGAASQAVPVTALGTVITNPSGNEVTPRNVSLSQEAITTTALTASQNFIGGVGDVGTSVTGRATRHRPVVMLNSTNLAPASLILEESIDSTTYRETWRAPIPIDNNYHTFDVPQHYRYFRWRLVNNAATAMSATFLSTLVVRGEGESMDVDKNLSFALTPAAGQALGTSATFTGPTIDLGGNHNWDRVRSIIASDQTGNAYCRQSIDGTNWVTVPALNSIASGIGADAFNGQVREYPIVGRYLSLTVINGATAAATLKAFASLVSL